MFAFAGTILLLALYNLNAGGVTAPNVLVGMLTFAGGMAMTLVAMWEIARGNTLFATCKPLSPLFVLRFPRVVDVPLYSAFSTLFPSLRTYGMSCHQSTYVWMLRR